MDAATDAYFEIVLLNGDDWVRDAERQRVEFEARLDERWGKALRLVDLMRLMCLEAGIEHHQRHGQGHRAQHHAIVRLHARACMIASEVLALLRSGHASGAHARWRALHEVTVIATFLGAHDDDLAERYLRYEHVESLAAARDYQKNAADLGYEPLPDSEIEVLERNVEQLCDQYGSLFRKRYGWAAHLFGYAPDYKTIEEATDLSHYRSYYRMASHPVHAGPKGITYDIGLLTPGRVMLAGPSNAGLADPGQGVCISLSQITAALLTLQPSAGNVVTLGVLLRLSSHAAEALMDAHWRLEKDEEEGRDREYRESADLE